jgi:hypothetical protein
MPGRQIIRTIESSMKYYNNYTVILFSIQLQMLLSIETFLNGFPSKKFKKSTVNYLY